MPVGPSPFNPEYQEWFSKRPSKVNRAKMKGLQVVNRFRELKNSLTGDVYKMPEQDYNELVKHFNEHHSELSQTYADGDKKFSNIQTPADYIDYAFDVSVNKKEIVTQECQGGHIKKLTYNALYMLLMVEFSNRGDICVFFNLPANVASRLMYYARSNTMAPPDKHGRERHAVGVEFWNLVRVRGTVHDTWYPFQYTNDMRTGNPFGRVPGSGVHGEGNKYDYLEDARKRKRYDKKTGEEITGPVAIRAKRGDVSEKMTHEDFDRPDDVFTEDDLAYYFDNGEYNMALGQKGANIKELQKAYDVYMSEDYGDPQEIVDMLRKAGAKNI